MRRRRAPASAAKLSIEGKWTGVGSFEDSESRAAYPVVCAKMTAKATRVSGGCQKYEVEGDLYALEMSCSDPNLSDTGKALFAQMARVCQISQDRAHEIDSNGREIFATGPSVQDPAEKSGQANSSLDVSPFDSSTYDRPPLPGLKEGIRFGYVRNFNVAGHRTSIRVNLFRAG